MFYPCPFLTIIMFNLQPVRSGTPANVCLYKGADPRLNLLNSLRYFANH